MSANCSIAFATAVASWCYSGCGSVELMEGCAAPRSAGCGSSMSRLFDDSLAPISTTRTRSTLAVIDPTSVGMLGHPQMPNVVRLDYREKPKQGRTAPPSARVARLVLGSVPKTQYTIQSRMRVVIVFLLGQWSYVVVFSKSSRPSQTWETSPGSSLTRLSAELCD